MPLDYGLGNLELGANAATMTLVLVSVLTYYLSWRWSEASRVRRMAKGGHAGSSALPSPVPLLPRWIPFVGGHTLQMETDTLNEQLEGWADEFGGDFELAVFGKRVIFVTKTEDARRIYVSRPTKFVRGWFPDQFFKISKKVGLNPSLFFDEGKEWGRSRRLISPALNGHQNVADMIPAITKIAERVCTKLGDQQGEMVDVAPIFERFTHDVIALAGFGFDADSVRATKDRPSVSYQAMGNILEALMALLMDPLTVLGWTIAPSLWPLARTTKEGSARLHHVVQVGKINPE